MKRQAAEVAQRGDYGTGPAVSRAGGSPRIMYLERRQSVVAHLFHYVNGSESSLKTERGAEAGRGRAGAMQQGREGPTPRRTGEE